MVSNSNQRQRSPKLSPATFPQQLAALQQFCAYQERCYQDVREKIRSWEVSHEDGEELISALVKENFLNEERFAKAFAGGKFRIKKWGWVKIKYELIQRGISNYCLQQAAKEIDPEIYRQSLTKLLLEKAKKLQGPAASFKKEQALVAFAVGKGYEAALAKSIVSSW